MSHSAHRAEVGGALDSIRARSLLFYGTGAFVVLLTTLDLVTSAVPARLITPAQHLTNAVLMALLMSATIQFIRPAVHGRPERWIIVDALAASCGALGWVLAILRFDIAPPVAAMSEVFIALAFIVAYVHLDRPVPAAPYLSVALLVLVGLLHASIVATLETGGLAVWIAAPLSFDVYDRPILAGGAAADHRKRREWYACLLGLPAAFSVFAQVGPSTLLGHLGHDGSRASDGLLALLLVHLYFSHILGRRRWHGGVADRRRYSRVMVKTG